MKAHNFRELNVWKLSRELVKEIYLITRQFPGEEKFGLVSQIRRAAISIPSNIAEGSARSDKDFMRFLSISLSSAYELETQIILAFDLNFLNEAESTLICSRIQELQKMIHGLQKKLDSTSFGLKSLFSFVFPLFSILKI